jgi:SAM-dependent methyltransferase
MIDPGAGLVARWPALRAAARSRLGTRDDGALDAAKRTRLAHAIERLSTLLTRERERVDEAYLADPELLAAYLAFYWPVSYAQARAILGELGDRPLGRVLDLGAGPLPMSWAALDAGASSVLALERVEAARALGLSLGQGLIEARGWEANHPLPEGPFDTIVCGHLLNELYLGTREPSQHRAALLAQALRRLSPDGRLVVIEPALRETSRGLLEVRDRLLADGAVVLAPCLMQAPCPARTRDSDWCHAERAWTPPAEHAALAQAARLHKERLKMSYLVLGVSPAPHHPADRFRVVSDRLDEKGKLVRIGCGPRGRHRLVLRERDRAEHNRDFDALERGDVVRAAALVEKGDGLRLAPEAEVERLTPAGAPPPAPQR